MRIAELRTLLLRVVDEIRAEHGVDVTLPQTSGGELAVTLTAWQAHAPRHRFVELWLALFRCAKQLNWLAQLETHVDARTGCSAPAVDAAEAQRPLGLRRAESAGDAARARLPRAVLRAARPRVSVH
jgi:hypothetical protein